jgi:hypothetical protein
VSIRFLNSFIVITLDYGCLVSLVILATPQVKGLYRGSDVVDLMWVTAC